MKEAKINFLFLCDGHNIGPAGKLNCIGIFNTFRVWAFPAQREASVIMYLYDIFKDEKAIINWVSPQGENTVLAKIKLKKSSVAHGFANVAYHLPIKIKEDGIHHIEGIVGETRKSIPIIVTKEKWPRFSKEEIKKLLEDPKSLKAARVEIECGKCGRKVTFEVNLDPNKKNTPGTVPFPKNGKYKCKTKTCDNTLFTKDMEGYALSLLGKTTSKGG